MHRTAADLYEKLSTLAAGTPDACGNGTSSPLTCAALVSALRRFHECVRYLNTRRSTGAILDIKSEAHVQDALYLMLRLWVTDLKNETPTDSIGNQYSIKDFLVPQARAVIEAKYVRDKHHAKHLMNELSQDIENYRHHPLCENIIFFVYDENSLIPNHEELRLAVESERSYGGRVLDCHLVVSP